MHGIGRSIVYLLGVKLITIGGILGVFVKNHLLDGSLLWKYPNIIDREAVIALLISVGRDWSRCKVGCAMQHDT